MHKTSKPEWIFSQPAVTGSLGNKRPGWCHCWWMVMTQPWACFPTSCSSSCNIQHKIAVLLFPSDSMQMQKRALTLPGSLHVDVCAQMLIDSSACLELNIPHIFSTKQFLLFVYRQIFSFVHKLNPQRIIIWWAVRQSFPIIGNKIGNEDFANWTGDIQKCDIWHEYSKYCGINVLCCMLYCKVCLTQFKKVVNTQYTLIDQTKDTGKGKQTNKRKWH